MEQILTLLLYYFFERFSLENVGIPGLRAVNSHSLTLKVVHSNVLLGTEIHK